MNKKIKESLNVSMLSNTITLCIAVVLYMVLSHLPQLKVAFGKVFNVISPFIYAFAIAFVLDKPIEWFQNKIFKNLKFKKALSMLVVYVIAILIVVMLFVLIMPQIAQNIATIVDTIQTSWPKFARNVEAFLEKYNISPDIQKSLENLWNTFGASITQYALALIPNLVNFSYLLGSGVFNILMTLIISVYTYSRKQDLIRKGRKIRYAFFSKEKADRFVYVCGMSSKIFSDFIVGKMIDSAIIGVLAFIGMLFIYPQFARMVAVIIGITNMIPVFGPFIGAIPTVFIMLIVNPFKALVLALFILCLQQLDGNIIGPNILGDSLGLSPLRIMVGIMIGNGLFGIVGMFIGVPCFAIIYKLIQENVSLRLTEKGYDLQSFESVSETQPEKAKNEK